VQDAKIGPDKDIPRVTSPMITKYISDLQLLGLLQGDGQKAVTGHE
jgi:fatty acid CoA ligase FadD9